MVAEHTEQSIEDRLVFPKFTIRMATKSHSKNDLKVYYGKDALMADLMNYWGSVDMAIQIFVKQKHLRPSIYRYYMKNGNVCKAYAICNHVNINRQSNVYAMIMHLIKEWQQKSYQYKERNEA